jgi:SAM-dependent methyltransferase
VPGNGHGASNSGWWPLLPFAIEGPPWEAAQRNEKATGDRDRGTYGACHLDFAADNSYGFVLFSHNGIDHLELPERERALVEMKRVLRPGGLMAFSSHNTNFLPVVVDNYRFRLRASLRETARSLKWMMVFNFQNPTLRFRLPLDVGMVKDGLHAFRSSGICYIRPDLQAAALARLGWTDIRCAMNDSAHFLDGSDPQVATFGSPWVYYRCRKPGRAA